MCELTADFWSGVVRAPVTSFRTTFIKEGFLPTSVQRVHFEGADDSLPRSAILKCARPGWQNDPCGAEREARVYTELLAHIPISLPARYLVSLGGAQDHTQIVLQDLEPDFAFYPEAHKWTWHQGRAMLRTYARLHAYGQMLAVSQMPYLMPRLHARWSPAGARAMFADLAKTAELSDKVRPALPWVDVVLKLLPALQELADKEPPTLIHYDAYPPNIAFARRDDQADAVLIDWALATCDIGEIDLAFIFTQPYQSDQLLDWREALRYYCERKAELTGCGYNWGERVEVFRYARIQAVFASLVPIHRAWQKAQRDGTPFSANSSDPFVRFYIAMLDDLIERLGEIAAAN